MAEEQKSLEMRVAELEDKLSKVMPAEGAAGAPIQACVVAQCVHCIPPCIVNQCVVHQCLVSQCVRPCVVQQCFECSCGPCAPGGIGGVGGAGFGGLGR